MKTRNFLCKYFQLPEVRYFFLTLSSIINKVILVKNDFWWEWIPFILLGGNSEVFPTRGGVQLIFSCNLLYKDIYTPETLSFIPLGGKSEVFPTQSPIEFLFLFIVYGYLYPWYLVFYLTITMTMMRPIFLSVNFFVLIQNIVRRLYR